MKKVWTVVAAAAVAGYALGCGARDAAWKEPPPPSPTSTRADAASRAAAEPTAPASAEPAPADFSARTLRDPLQLARPQDFVAARLEPATLARAPSALRAALREHVRSFVGLDPAEARCEVVWAFWGAAAPEDGPTPTLLFQFRTREEAEAFRRDYLPEELDVERRSVAGEEFRLFTSEGGRRQAYAALGDRAFLVAAAGVMEDLLAAKPSPEASLAGAFRRGPTGPFQAAIAFESLPNGIFDPQSDLAALAERTSAAAVAVDLAGPRLLEAHAWPRVRTPKSLLAKGKAFVRGLEVAVSEPPEGFQAVLAAVRSQRGDDASEASSAGRLVVAALRGAEWSFDESAARVVVPRPPEFDAVDPPRPAVQGNPGLAAPPSTLRHLADVVDVSRKPLLSWRVELMAFWDPPLYRAFDRTQPWDSERNLPLAEEMSLRCFGSPGAAVGATSWRLVGGPRVAFAQGGEGTAVPWTKPDAPVDPARPLDAFGPEPPGGYVAVLRSDLRKTVRLSAAELARELRPPMRHPGASVAACGAGLAASGGQEGEIRLWDLEQQTLRAELPGAGVFLTALAFAPDGLLISGDYQGTVRIWNVAERRLLRTLDLQEGPVRGFAMLRTAHGNRFVAAGPRTTLRLRNLPEGDVAQEFPGKVHHAAFSPDGTLLAAAAGGETGAGRIEWWDVAAGKLQRTVQVGAGGVRSLAFSPDGALLVAGGDRGGIFVWDEAGRPQPPFAFPSKDHGLSLSSPWSVDHLAFDRAGGRLVGAAESLGELAVGTWAAADRSRLSFRDDLARALQAFAFGPDGAAAVFVDMSRLHVVPTMPEAD